MHWLEWGIVGLIVGLSALYSIRRLLPRRRGGSSCGGCAAHDKRAAK